MTDIASWLAEAAGQLGRTTSLVDRPPAGRPGGDQPRRRPARVLRAVAAPADAEINRAAAVSIAIGTEQPGTPWFGRTRCRPSGRRPARARHQRPRGRRRSAPGQRRRSPAAARRRTGDDSAGPRRRETSTCCSSAGDTRRRGDARSPRPGARRPAGPSCACSASTAPVRPGHPASCSAPTSTPCWRAPRSSSTSIATTGLVGYFEWARMVEAMANALRRA